MADITSGLLIVGSVSIPVHNYFRLTQDYTLIGGSHMRRSQSGTGRKQTHWTRIGTTISASGSLPVGLADMDFSLPYDIHCAAFRSIKSATNTISIVGNFRVDAGYAPRGFGLIGSNWVEGTPVESPAGTFTIGGLVGAASYELRYYPILTVFSDPPSETNDIHNRDSGWVLTAEEV